MAIPRVRLISTACLPAIALPTSARLREVLHRTGVTRSWPVEQRFAGGVLPGQLACKFTFDLESWLALGWHSAYLRSQQSHVGLLSKLCTIRHNAPIFANANGTAISPSSPGLGTSPNPALGWHSVLFERHRHRRQERHSERLWSRTTGPTSDRASVMRTT